MKDSIKRAQSRAGSGFAERENFRPKVKQLKKTLLTLVALLAVTTGAWADETLLTTITATGTDSYSETTPGVVTVTHDNDNSWNEYGWVWWSKAGSVTVEAKDGYTITRCVFSQPYDKTPVTVSTAPFKVNFIYNEDNEEYICEGSDPDEGMDGVSSIEVYGYVKPAAASTPFAITWSAATPNTASIAAMPAGNVTVSVDYFAQAELAKSTDATPVALAPAAIADVPANTDAPIVTPGTVANIGTSEVKQGTLMYFVSQTTGDTAPEAPDYDTDGWSDKVPTANELKQGKAYVWYYIHGAEPTNIADRTDANTRSDSDIKPLGTTGFVTLGAEPTYAVSLNKTDLAEGEPALWKAKSTNVAEVNLGEADLEGVKKSETVTVTYTGSKKIIGVKAEKKAPAATLQTVNITGNTSATLYFLPGETFGEAIANHPENTSFKIKDRIIYCNDIQLFIVNYSSQVTPNTPVDANGDYKALLI